MDLILTLIAYLPLWLVLAAGAWVSVDFLIVTPWREYRDRMRGLKD